MKLNAQSCAIITLCSIDCGPLIGHTVSVPYQTQNAPFVCVFVCNGQFVHSKRAAAERARALNACTIYHIFAFPIYLFTFGDVGKLRHLRLLCEDDELPMLMMMPMISVLRCSITAGWKKTATFAQLMYFKSLFAEIQPFYSLQSVSQWRFSMLPMHWEAIRWHIVNDSRSQNLAHALTMRKHIYICM